jgi:hypothetical protein
MTRDDATKIITDALGPASTGTSLADNQAFAQRLAAALDALGLIPAERHPDPLQRDQASADQIADSPPWLAQQQSDPHQPTHHATTDASGTVVSTPHPMTQSQHGITPGPTAAEASWRRQPIPDAPSNTIGEITNQPTKT